MDLPKMSAGFSIAIKGRADVNYTYLGEIPKEIMDEFEKLVGNGLAKVSIAIDLGIKDFGTGASAMCAVSLSCNQDGATIERASQVAAWAAKKFAVQYRAEADQEIQNILGPRGTQMAPSTPTFPPPTPRYG
jgi:hypothetical protein